MRVLGICAARIAEEGEPDHARHVECAENDARESESEERGIAMLQHCHQYLVLAEEAAKGCDAGERSRSYDECQRSQRHGAPQASHPPHVCLFVHAVHHAARAEEEHRLRYAVRDEVEDGGGESERAQREHHQAQMAYGGVRQRALDVGHHQGEGASVQEGYQSDDSYDEHHDGRKLEQGQHARYEIYARGDHRGGVYERADGGGTLHRIRQPHMERELRRLAHRSHEQQQRGCGERTLTNGTSLRHFDDVANVEGAGGTEQKNDANQQAHIADARGDERFLRSLRSRAPFPPVADEQVRAKPD